MQTYLPSADFEQTAKWLSDYHLLSQIGQAKTIERAVIALMNGDEQWAPTDEGMPRNLHGNCTVSLWYNGGSCKVPELHRYIRALLVESAIRGYSPPSTNLDVEMHLINSPQLFNHEPLRWPPECELLHRRLLLLRDRAHYLPLFGEIEGKTPERDIPRLAVALSLQLTDVLESYDAFDG